MIRIIATGLLCLGLLGQQALAGDRDLIGRGGVIVNDSFGDLHDRWRTGSAVGSRVWGPEWTGRAPEGFGRLLELRFGGQIIAPANTRTPDPRDRPYAGALFAGLHTHFSRGAMDFALGADLVVTGPQTGLDDFQDALHDLAGIDQTSDGVRAGQIENGVHPTLVFEAGRDLRLSPGAVLRPFVEARWGDETLLRVGGDLVLGTVGQGELWVRDAVTGHRYRTVRQPFSGFAFVLGADVAHVADSVYLPEARGYELTDTRTRLRMGLHYEGRKARLFYGLTYMGEEFDDQPEGQLSGAVSVNFRF
ncbi:hypothetical protein SAMN05216196_103469 [Lutimaribacter pacificus]|uniref:Lipid A deacylase LpxR family protein n=1 Tax=Lutimaribacter pacificus TaxID=391948 RepID=A0A1H0H0S4_9RHOB|nr:lipid A-modifier LpxR family protein [Lutimaribacter pacificus]SDO12662.1 hypothetical protein SAMN05216196_103469 [Lutimaribacter pacificus]SHJ94343.1 hypothetical protein SAMN05444142_102470 [Lutimaribacter pacificus]